MDNIQVTKLILELIALLVTVACTSFGLWKLILKLSIDPLKEKVVALEKKIHILEGEHAGLEGQIIDKLNDIALGNADFRVKYSDDMGALKLLLAERYVSREELVEKINALKESIKPGNNDEKN
jgi:uncharacterized protein YlzI (FlbEa/FlbD family)